MEEATLPENLSVVDPMELKDLSPFSLAAPDLDVLPEGIPS